MADQEDEKLIDIVEKHNKDAATILELLEQASGNIAFPITDAKQLIDALGGPNVKVRIGDKDVPVGSLAQAFQLDEKNIKVIAAFVGGGFGSALRTWRGALVVPSTPVTVISVMRCATWRSKAAV